MKEKKPQAFKNNIKDILEEYHPQLAIVN